MSAAAANSSIAATTSPMRWRRALRYIIGRRPRSCPITARAASSWQSTGWRISMPLRARSIVCSPAGRIDADVLCRLCEGEMQVARIAGVNIPNQKRVPIGLTYIYGIGRSKALEICNRVGIPLDRRVHEMTDEEILRVRELIDREYTVEGDLRREVAMNIKRLMDLGCYRGLRHRKGLPVRGQRTHTNARTRKGPARPIAGKKK